MKQLADGFWNFRGSFKIGGLIDIGTQMSLVRRGDGRFLLIDSYSVEDDDKRELLALTDGGAAIDAIVNVHPFHTLHCKALHRLVPQARLIGTKRHQEQLPDLPWKDGVIEDEGTQAEFADELEFTVPDGLLLVTPDDSVHAASVMVRHRASSIVHVDDTLNVLAAPGFLKRLVPTSGLRFHPMLVRALEPHAAAADAFDAWARDIAERWAGTPVVCAAHSAIRSLDGDGWREEVLQALSSVQKTLDSHRAKYR